MIPADPERALVLAYAPAEVRPSLAVLWRLDERLGEIVAATREDRIGEIRLAWWREALEKLDRAPPPDEPLLCEVAVRLLPCGIAGGELGGIADGWALLLTPPPLPDEALLGYAQGRGGRLFALAGRLLGGPGEALDAAGEGWALVDLAFRMRDARGAARALALARGRFGEIAGRRWPGALRPLGALTVVAAGDAAAGCDRPRRPGSPRRVARMLAHRISGR